jgi:hypothetical protein
MSNNFGGQQAAWSPTGDPETLNEPVIPNTLSGQLGIHVQVKDPGPAGAPVGTSAVNRDKNYQLVRSDSTMSVSPFRGAVAWWSNKATYLVTTSPTTLGRGRIAGIFGNAVTPGNYCYVQTFGPCTVKFVDAPTAAPSAAGLFVIPSATAGKADAIAAGTASTYPVLGYSASAITGSDSTALVDLDVPYTA